MNMAYDKSLGKLVRKQAQIGHAVQKRVIEALVDTVFCETSLAPTY
jgi:hypothetical protein